MGRKKRPGDYVTFSLRLPKTIHAQLEEIAARKDLPLTTLISHLIPMGIEVEKQLQPLIQEAYRIVAAGELENLAGVSKHLTVTVEED